MTSTRYRFQLLDAGPLKLDGGGMFGVVPRVIWSKFAPPDDQNRVQIGHNCLLLTRADQGPGARASVLIETGSGDKFDEKNRAIFGLTDRTVFTAMAEAGASPDDLTDVIVSHLHFDHAGGVTRKHRTDPAPGAVELSFPHARVHAQKREWEDALANNSVMTRTYLRDHLDPIRDRIVLTDSPKPFAASHVLQRNDTPQMPLEDRMTEVAPGIFAFLVPGHTWGQQAILFVDDRGRTIVFTPDVLPTAWHVGSAYSIAYDVEPFTTMISKRWLLEEAVKRSWVLALDHEPSTPLVTVAPDGKGWYKLTPAT